MLDRLKRPLGHQHEVLSRLLLEGLDCRALVS